MMSGVTPAQKVGLVLAGGGARGAYEAGALAILLPALEERGESPRVIVGTSIGAVGCAFVAGSAHRPAAEVALGAQTWWSRLRRGDVMGSLIARLPVTALRLTGQVLGIPRVRLTNLVSTAPLRTTLARGIDWDHLHANIAGATIDSAAVVASNSDDGSSVVFFEGRGEPPRDGRRLRYVKTSLTPDHVRASAAIPILFSPVRVTEPAAADAWYLDGGTRLNTPIKPAIDQGADRVIVIAVDAIDTAPASRPHATPPEFGDALAHLLQGALVDPLVEDLRRMASVNALVGEGADDGRRRIPYIVIAPPERDTISALALQTLRKRYRGLRALRSPELTLLVRLLGGHGANRGVLLSMILFDNHFIEALMQQGRDDARRWLDNARGPDAPWHAGPLDKRPGAGVR
jgi:NTE family protein